MTGYQSLEDSVRGKTAFITGGSSGIGRACVELFCHVGVNVVTTARRAGMGEALAAEVNARGRGQCRFYACDVKDTPALEKAVDYAVEAFGSLDILVNNAGYFPPQLPIDKTDVDAMRDVIETNLIAYLAACKFAMPHLRRAKGSVVNISSVHGTTSLMGAVGYDASKGGIDAATRTLAIDEAKNGVRVNNVKPGFIMTEINERGIAEKPEAQRADFKAWLDSVQWMGRGGQPLEVAQAVLFLASPWAGFITGAELMVSGGYELGEGPKITSPFLAWE